MKPSISRFSDCPGAKATKWSMVAVSIINRLACLGVCLCTVAVQAPADAQALKLPPVTRITLQNGIRVVLMEYHRAPSISVNAIFPGGTATDSRDKAGTAGLAAELMRKGTQTRSASQIAESIDFLGGSLAAGASLDRLSVRLNVQSKDTEAGIDLFADVIRKPTFPEEELDRERKLSVDALESIGEDPESVSRRVATAAVFAGHPYGIQPTVGSLKAIAREDVLSYYRRFVVPDHMILVAVGDFKTADMLARLKAKFEDWPRAGTDTAAIPKVAAAARKRILVDKPDATQTQVRWIRTGIPRTSADYFAAELANTILGGGFTSRLIDEIRVNQSLTYGIGSGFAEMRHGGSFVVSTFTKTETTRAIINSTQAVLRRTAKEGITPAELQKVKGYLVGMFAISMQTPDALAGQLGEIAFYGLPNDYLQTYLARLRAVTLAEANRIARAYFSPETMTLVLVAPAAKVQPQLKGFGAFDVVPVGTVGK